MTVIKARWEDVGKSGRIQFLKSGRAALCVVRLRYDGRWEADFAIWDAFEHLGSTMEEAKENGLAALNELLGTMNPPKVRVCQPEVISYVHSGFFFCTPPMSHNKPSGSYWPPK